MLNIFNDTFKDTILYYSGNTLENKIKVLENFQLESVRVASW